MNALSDGLNAKDNISVHEDQILSHMKERNHNCNECLVLLKKEEELNNLILVHLQQQQQRKHVGKSSSDPLVSDTVSVQRGKCVDTLASPGKPNDHDYSMLTHKEILVDDFEQCVKNSKKDDILCSLEKEFRQDNGCSECGIYFTSKKLLKKHKYVHRNGKDIISESKGIVNNGFSLAMASESNNCKLLNDAEMLQDYIKGADNTLNHVKHKRDKFYKCGKCEKQFVYRAAFRKHIISHNMKNKCKICGQFFPNANDLVIHKLKHEKAHFQCEICGKQFTTNANLEMHKVVHTGQKDYQCEVCGKRFSQRSNMRSHMQTHTGEKPHVCTHCGKRFGRKSCLTVHMLIHSGDKKFMCPECGKVFSVKGNLTRHMTMHSGEKKYECEICCKKLAQKAHLQYHLTLHSKGKNYFCQVCGLVFFTKGDVRNHKLVHSGKTTYKCEICDRLFIQRGSLTSHMAIHSEGKRKN